MTNTTKARKVSPTQAKLTIQNDLITMEKYNYQYAFTNNTIFYHPTTKPYQKSITHPTITPLLSSTNTIIFHQHPSSPPPSRIPFSSNTPSNPSEQSPSVSDINHPIIFQNIPLMQKQDDFFKSSLGQSKLTRTIVEHRPKRPGKSSSKQQPQKQQGDKFKVIKKKFRKKIGITQEQNVQKTRPATQKPIVIGERQIETVCEILKYMLGQYNNEGKAQYCNEYNTCEKWELDEIMRQVSDTNLGDFIIKCPNPDHISEVLEGVYGKVEEGKELFKLNASQAMEFYYDLFDIESASKLDSQREHVAFLLAFYFLKFKNTLEESDELCLSYLRVYNYFKMVEMKSLADYLTMRADEQFQAKHQLFIKQNFKKQFSEVKCFIPEHSVASTDQVSWNRLKITIYSHLNLYITRQFEKYLEEEQREKERKKNEQQENNDDHIYRKEEGEFFRILMGKVKSVSDLLKTFPELLEKVLKHIKKEAKSEERILFGGQYLKRTVAGENVIWVISKDRPNDVTTLLRMSLIYKLVVKSKLFVRTFLSKDQHHIMLVIKTSEQILQNYAQKYKITMEVDLGASDLFSFEPVDHYLRPLRLHSYIRDLEFREKYNIRGGKAANDDELKSIQSEATIFYQKIQAMNEDQLRTNIITDQFQADKSYQWISRKLNIDYIKQKVLTNDYNTQNPSRNTWQLYFLYNKMIIQFVGRAKRLYEPNKKAKEYFQELDGNIGMILRLMFLRALNICNELFFNYRETRSIIPRTLSNLWTTKTKLRNIWHYMGIESPSGFSTYRRTKSNEKLWRKFEINELKDRSKFFPAERLTMTNKVISDNINISKALQQMHIVQYYPLHDPFVLKNIEISPYIANVKKLKPKQKKTDDGPDASVINKLYSQYQCQYTKGDFTKMSVEDKLKFKCSQFKTFSSQSIRYYCGEKIAYYFEFIKFLALKAYPFILLAMIIQLLLWVEQTDILAKGTSTLTGLNNVLIFIYTFINVFWTTNLVEKWKYQEKVLSQKYGVSQLAEFQEKRVKFEGSFKRNFETDQLNFQYVPKWKTALKTLFTLILNLAYVFLVAVAILLLFLFKTYLYQKGLNQTIVNQVPSILISIASQVFSKIYMIILKKITIFENHKTVSEYEASLISKASLVTFIINFYSIFIFAYFSDYLASSYVCEIKTTLTLQRIQNCDYFVSSQLLSLVGVDAVMAVVGALLPFFNFYILPDLLEKLFGKKKKKDAKFNYNFFQSIDSFYEQQDKMQTYMFNQQLDNTWQGYMSIINVLTATALFAPALPFAYAMMFFSGILRLHASKFEIIYFSKRILPIKTNSINWWLIIIQAISYLSIVTNIAYMIYTRQVFVESRAKYFFLFIIIFFSLKYYLLSQYNEGENLMAKRNQIKTTDLLLGRRKDKYENIPQEVNTDIQNVIYDQVKLDRKFHNIKQPNIKAKATKKNN